MQFVLFCWTCGETWTMHKKYHIYSKHCSQFCINTTQFSNSELFDFIYSSHPISYHIYHNVVVLYVHILCINRYSDFCLCFRLVFLGRIRLFFYQKTNIDRWLSLTKIFLTIPIYSLVRCCNIIYTIHRQGYGAPILQ